MAVLAAPPHPYRRSVSWRLVSCRDVRLQVNSAIGDTTRICSSCLRIPQLNGSCRCGRQQLRSYVDNRCKDMRICQRLRMIRESSRQRSASDPDGAAKSDGNQNKNQTRPRPCGRKVLERGQMMAPSAPDAYRRDAPGVYVPTAITINSMWPGT